MACTPMEWPTSTHLVGVELETRQLSVSPICVAVAAAAALSSAAVVANGGTISPILSHPSVAAWQASKHTPQEMPHKPPVTLDKKPDLASDHANNVNRYFYHIDPVRYISYFYAPNKRINKNNLKL